MLNNSSRVPSQPYFRALLNPNHPILFLVHIYPRCERLPFSPVWRSLQRRVPEFLTGRALARLQALQALRRLQVLALELVLRFTKCMLPSKLRIRTVRNPLGKFSWPCWLTMHTSLCRRLPVCGSEMSPIDQSRRCEGYRIHRLVRSPHTTTTVQS